MGEGRMEEEHKEENKEKVGDKGESDRVEI